MKSYFRNYQTWNNYHSEKPHHGYYLIFVLELYLNNVYNNCIRINIFYYLTLVIHFIVYLFLKLNFCWQGLVISNRLKNIIFKIFFSWIDLEVLLTCLNEFCWIIYRSNQFQLSKCLTKPSNFAWLKLNDGI